MKPWVPSLVLARVLSGCGPESAARAAPGPTLEEKVKATLPTAAEDRWLHIPWRADLAAAREEAQRTGKPLYMWVMDGNPLGCG